MFRLALNRILQVSLIVLGLMASGAVAQDQPKEPAQRRSAGKSAINRQGCHHPGTTR